MRSTRCTEDGFTWRVPAPCALSRYHQIALRIPRKIKALPLLLAERATDRATEQERKAQRYGRALNGTGGQRNGLRDPHPTKPPKPPRRVSSVIGPPLGL